MHFPQDFIWGAAAAAYQIEGATEEDGKGLSVWDVMCREPGRIVNGQTGDIACDHYHRFSEDIGLMKRMGLGAYRLSLSWPRILPNGVGKVNRAGLDFYDKLIDGLLEAGIKPFVTLFHWDYPYELYKQGGWLNRACVEWFAEYTRVVVDAFSNRVTNWITLNEPQSFIFTGHRTGQHAPGLKLSMSEVLLAAHHALLSHGRAVQVIREHAKSTPYIGWSPIGVVYHPRSRSAEDVERARQKSFSIVSKENMWNNTWFNDPAILGHYPEDGLTLYGKDAPVVQKGDMELIAQPIDYYGTTIYLSMPEGDKNSTPLECQWPVGHPANAWSWPIEPSCLYWGPKFLYERYKLPILIMENGYCGTDWVSLDGKVHDPQRIDYTQRHLLELHRAMAEGVDIRGYIHWSLMDNFEWAEGYQRRFGLIHVDFTNQKRTIKDSGHWYKNVIESRGESLWEGSSLVAKRTSALLDYPLERSGWDIKIAKGEATTR
jgi:beta-glucosidase